MANELTRVKDGGAWKTATAIHVKDGGAWKPVKSIWVHDAGGWRKVYFRSFRFNHTYTADTASPRMSTLATSLGWNGVDPVVGTVVVDANFFSNSLSSYAFYCDGLPAGSLINLTLNAGRTIGGRGGEGGWASGGSGGNGGHAMYVRNAMTVTNHGTVAGGGGGGGGGGNHDSPAVGGSGGGGGRGWSNPGLGNGNVGYVPGLNGIGGTFSAAGAGGAGVYHAVGGGEEPLSEYLSGAGGNGGDWGQAGQAGSLAVFVQTGATTGAAGPGGAPGWAVDGNSFVTWTAAGTRFGHLGN